MGNTVCKYSFKYDLRIAWVMVVTPSFVVISTMGLSPLDLEENTFTG
jgi:hypothetical protein